MSSKTCPGCSHPTICRTHGCGAEEVRRNRRTAAGPSAEEQLVQAAAYALDVLNQGRGKQARLRAIERLNAALLAARPHTAHQVTQARQHDEGDYDLGLDGRPNSQRA